MIFRISLIHAGKIGWVGIAMMGETELYRTGNYHASAEGALEKVQEWIEENEVPYA